jgi:hypothetical protein
VRPAEVLDHKADLMVRLQDPRVYQGFRDQTEMDMRWEDGDGNLVEITRERRERNRSNAAAIISTLKAVLPEAECFHVSEDMVRLVQFAATQLDQTDRFQRLMLPTRSGIVRFEGGLPWVDVRGKQLRLSWAVWGPITARYYSRHDVGEPNEWTHFWLFNDQIDEPDSIAQEMFQKAGEARVRQVFGRWGYMGGEFLADGERLGPAMRNPTEAKMAEILADGEVPSAYTNPSRLMCALWFLLGQTITQTDEAHLDRAVRKRAGKARIPARVTVIQLRNIESRRAPGESLVEWNHRWIVRGHPAWRACGPDHPLAELYPGATDKYRCRVWIAPFEKGPKDKPLIINEKVYSLSR